MRKLFTFLLTMGIAVGLNAQYIYSDFDENQNETFNGFPNPVTIIANPNPSGINTSPNVGEWIRSTEQFANIQVDLAGRIDFSTGTIFELKFHTPVACQVLFKIEQIGNAGIFAERPIDVSTINEWVQLSFDFSGEPSDTYDKLVIFFDFNNNVDNVFYFDDVTGPEYGEPGIPVDLPVTFEDEDVVYALTDFGGNASSIVADPTDANNTVAQSVKTEGAELWAGTTVGGAVGFANPIPFTETFTKMSVRVWSPLANIPIRLKVEDAADDEISVETEAIITTAETWQTLTFDFLNEAEGTAELNLDNTYNKASMFFNFGTPGSETGEQTYFWDDMIFLDNTNVQEQSADVISVFPVPASDAISLTYTSKVELVKIFASDGTLVYQSEAQPESVNISDWAPGMYILVYEADGRASKQHKIIKR